MTMTITPPREIRREIAGETLRRITEHPETHDQNQWLRQGHDHGLQDLYRVDDVHDFGTDATRWAACGTVACVAGHAVAAALQRADVHVSPADEISDAAAELLGLAVQERRYLFATDRTLPEISDALRGLSRGEYVIDHITTP
ncbi:MAG: hypothetical protein F4Y04_03885 [Chloroflexi bacterium]|nr:hypothetical protein [Chloroflexota bacterium]